MSDYDFGQSRKEKYVGPGTGSITITPDRKGYSKTGSGKRMKISERNTYKPGRVIIESSYTGSEYRKHLDSQKTRGNPSWEKESAEFEDIRKGMRREKHRTEVQSAIEEARSAVKEAKLSNSRIHSYFTRN